MKKQLLLLSCLLLSASAFAQYTLSGTVTTSTSSPVSGQTVYAMADSLLNPPGTTYWMQSGVTNSSGTYTITMPSAITSGTIVRVTTANCSGPDLVNTPTYAGVNLTSNFTKCATSSIFGLVTLGTSMTGAANAKVYFIDLDTSLTAPVLTLVDSALTNVYGNYTASFPTLSGSHRIIVKAFLLPASSVYSSYLPTYSSSSLLWSGASAYLTCPSGGINVALKAGTNPGGPAFIGGSVLLGANKTTAVGDPLPGREIILADNNNNPVAYAYSDAAGLFSFPNLTYGTYKIYGDVFGKTSTPLSITLSASSQTVNNVLFEEKSKTFNASLNTTGINNIQGSATIAVYPNPVKAQLTISGVATGSDVVVFDVYGRKVIEQTATQSTEVINTAALATGTYVLQVTDAMGNKLTQKIVKE